KNKGNSSFERISGHTLTSEDKKSRGAIWFDADGDGDQDLFITNEENVTNDFFINNGNETFSKRTTGTLVTSKTSSITASAGDIDNDGDIDLFVGNSGYFQPLKNQLFKNNGTGEFTEITNDA